MVLGLQLKKWKLGFAKHCNEYRSTGMTVNMRGQSQAGQERFLIIVKNLML